MKIFYTGVGCNKTGEHTVDEFLNIMNKEFAHKNIKNVLKLISDPVLKHFVEKMIEEDMKFKDWVLPDDFIFFTLTDWIEYSGAEII